MLLRIALRILLIASLPLWAPFAAVLYLRTGIALVRLLCDGEEHSLRDILRAMPRHPWFWVLELLNALVAKEGTNLFVRGRGPGRRYRVIGGRRWRPRATAAERLGFGEIQIGGTAWAH
jgi:hypothetical protein